MTLDAATQMVARAAGRVVTAEAHKETAMIGQEFKVGRKTLIPTTQRHVEGWGELLTPTVARAMGTSLGKYIGSEFKSPVHTWKLVSLLAESTAFACSRGVQVRGVAQWAIDPITHMIRYMVRFDVLAGGTRRPQPKRRRKR